MKGAHHKQFRCPPFDLLNFTQTRRHTNEQKEHPHSEEGTPCSNCNKNRRIETGQLKLKKKRKEPLNYSLSLHFSQHIPLLKSHSPSMLRERLQERGYRRCARNPQKKTCPHFLRTHHHRCSKQGISGSHTSTHLSAQDKSHRPKGILLSHHVETDQGTYFHCFGWDAGPEFNHLPTGPNKDKHLTTAVCPTSLAPCLSRPGVIENHDFLLSPPLPPSLLRSHFGSSHFLFKRSRWFSL